MYFIYIIKERFAHAYEHKRFTTIAIYYKINHRQVKYNTYISLCIHIVNCTEMLNKQYRKIIYIYTVFCSVDKS